MDHAHKEQCLIYIHNVLIKAKFNGRYSEWHKELASYVKDVESGRKVGRFMHRLGSRAMHHVFNLDGKMDADFLHDSISGGRYEPLADPEGAEFKSAYYIYACSYARRYRDKYAIQYKTKGITEGT